MKNRWGLAIVALLLSPINAIFRDEAFHSDYHQALLGIPQAHTTFFHKPQSASNASLLYTISDKAILGAVNPRDGSLVWRQALAEYPLENAQDTFLVAGDANGKIISGFQSTVSSWDALDGRLNWDYTLDAGSVVKGVQTVPTITEGAENIVQDIVAVVGSSTSPSVVRLAGDGTGPRWTFDDSSVGSDTQYSIATSPKYVYYITKSTGILLGSKAKVVVIDIITGQEVNQYSVAVDSEVLRNVASLSVGSGSETPFLLSTEKPFTSLKLNLLGNSKTTTINLEDKSEVIEELSVHHPGSLGSISHFLVHVKGKSRHWAEVFHINPKSGDAIKAYSLPATSEVSTFSATAVGPVIYYTRITDSEVLLYSSESHGQLGRWPRSGHSSHSPSQSLHAVTEVSTRGASGIALRVALSSDQTGWSLIRNGEQSWIRPEILAYVDKAVWADEVISIALAQEIEAEAGSNPVSAYLHRLKRHVQDLKYLPEYVVSGINSIFDSPGKSGKSTRDLLIGTKLILASTTRGEILAFDTAATGSIKWIVSLSQPETSSPKVVHITVDGGYLTVYLESGEFVVVNTATGRVEERLTSSTPFHQLIEIPGQSASAIVRVSAAGEPTVFSELAKPVPVEGNVIVTVTDKGEAIGWSVGSSIEQIWTLRPENGAKVVSVVSRPPHDPVASIGQVLGNRSVLYKYINPNVALITALASSTLTVYVVNSVTGAVLHTATHENVLTDLPITATASGNKFVYSFTIRDFTTSGLSSQIIVSELFEAEAPNDRGLLQAKSNYSSFSPDAGATPYVISKAFTLAEPVSHLTISQTAQGITSREILGYLSNSKSIVAIPNGAINARRPVDRDPTADEVEEGLYRYSPILELDPKHFLSHSQDVLGIKRIMTAPTQLESTSLIFAFGHDVFGTLVAPSNTFDVLGKEFNRVQLILTVVALYVGVLALRPLIRKKVVERRWA